MVSPNSSTEDASSGSMEEREKRFYSRSANSRQAPPSTSSSESESESDSDYGSPRVSTLPQKKPQPPSRNVASSPKPSSTKRPRDEEQSQGPEKNKKPKEFKKPPPLETPKQNDKKTGEEKRKVRKSDSSSKSVKKNGQLWNTQDEIGFLKGFVAYQESKGLPKTNMSPVYDYIRKLNLLEHEYTNIQMYDKLRRLRGKFTGLKEKIDAGDYKFKTPHEETLYKLCRKIWGSGEEEEEESMDEEDEKNGGEGAEEDGKKSKGQDVEMAQKENEEEEEEEEDEDESIAREGNLAPNGAQKQSKQSNAKENRKPSLVSDVVLNNGSTRGAGEVIDVLRKETLAMINEIKVQLVRDKQEIKNETMEMVREALRSSVSTGTSDSVQFSSDEMIKRISSTREWPTLGKEEAEKLEHKWHKQNLVELDACYKHLQLLQEECQLRMEKLRSRDPGM